MDESLTALDEATAALADARGLLRRAEGQVSARITSPKTNENERIVLLTIGAKSNERLLAIAVDLCNVCDRSVMNVTMKLLVITSKSLKSHQWY